MLYRTHHPFFFQFHTFPSSISPSAPATTTNTNTTSLPSVSLSKSSPSLQVETEMECVEAALKTSFKKEMAVKSSPQAGFEDLWAVNTQNGVSCDDFFVDELLDLSNEDGFVEQDPKEEEEEEEDDDEDKGFVSVSSQQDRENSNRSTTFSAKDQFATEPTSELSVPADDLADLEWLSHFVEDSFSEFSAAYHLPTGILTEKPKNKVPEPEREPKTPVSTQPYFKTPVPAKARSKRTRTGGRVWSLGSPSLTESSSSSTSSSSSSSPSTPLLIYTNTALNMEPVEPVYPYGKPPPAKKQKKKPAPASDSAAAWGGVAQPPRRCTHCGVQKTPQWRTGPLGAKTLCNACGVRYKSGRLLPEYRPACSPTYSSDLHSNHHRKVLEMRRKKEPPGGTESGLAPTVVPSF